MKAFSHGVHGIWGTIAAAPLLWPSANDRNHGVQNYVSSGHSRPLEASHRHIDLQSFPPSCAGADALLDFESGNGLFR